MKYEKSMDKSNGLLKSTGNSSSSSVGAHIPEADNTVPAVPLLPSLRSGPRTPKFSLTAAHDLPVPGSGSFGHECTTGLERGIKRTFDVNENEAHVRKQQKICHYTQKKFSRGVKRKSASDHSEQPRKRFKATQPDVKIQQPNIEKGPSVSNSTYCNESKSVPTTDNSVDCIGSADTGDISNAQHEADSSNDIAVEESRATQSEQAEDENPCSRSCVCNVGHSRLPEPIEREFPKATPMYRCVLMRRLYCLSNTQYTCCKHRCVRKYPRESVMRVSLRHMTEDYYESDLHVTRYSWGEWKG